MRKSQEKTNKKKKSCRNLRLKEGVKLFKKVKGIIIMKITFIEKVG